MVMKKNMDSEKMKIVGNAGHSEKFPVNFKYIFGSDVFTIKEAYVSDNTEMRTVMSDKGDQTILTVASLIKDSKDPSFKVLNDVKEEKEDEKND